MASRESTELAAEIVNDAINDGLMGSAEMMIPIIAEALEKSWQQGFDDAEAAQRIERLRIQPR